MLRAICLLIAALGCFGLVALAQPAADKKGDAVKGKDDGKNKTKEPDKAKTPEKSKEAPKDPPKAKVPLDTPKLPKDTVVIVVDNVLEAMSLFSDSKMMVKLEDWLDLKEKIKTLERQLKPDRKIPSYCHLVGEQVGDFVEFDAEFLFSTEASNTNVLLGLQGGYLLKSGQLDGQTPIYDHNKDDGFLVKVAKDASEHRLVMSFRVPVQTKKSAGGAIERGFELGLPGAVVTTLSLRLPDNVKELRCNEVMEKTKKDGRWKPALAEKARSLALTWKEPTAFSGSAPLRKAEAQIKVDIDATYIDLTAELFLEDSRPQTKEWQLLLPKQAKIKDVKAPAGITVDWVKSDDKPYHVLTLSEATAERVQVTISMRAPRPSPGARFAVGPFFVLGAFEQKGTINVKMPSEAGIGQRLTYVRSDGVYDVQQASNTEIEALFHYGVPPGGDKSFKAPAAQKAPLELEWRAEKNQLETQVAHELIVRPVGPAWEIDIITSINVKSAHAAINAVDLKLPQPRPRGLGLIGAAAPGLAFPGAIPWSGAIDNPWGPAEPDEFKVQDEQGSSFNPLPLDASGKVRVQLERAPKEITLKLRGTVRLAPETRRFRVELPRPLGTQNRGATVTIRADERIELLQGAEGAETPLPDRHHFRIDMDQAPNVVDLAWKPYQREIVAQSTIDVTVHEHTAQIRQELRFPRERPMAGNDAKTALIALRVPPGIDKVTQIIAGLSKDYTPSQGILWLPAGMDGETVVLQLHYDLALTKAHVLQMAPLAPAHASKQDVKVRVWTSSGVKARLTEDLIARGMWKERSIEVVRDKEQFPALVLQGHGTNLPLSLKIEDATASTLAAFLAERALIQVRMLEDGSQHCKARYFIRKIHAPHVDIELPAPLAWFKERPTFTLGAVRTSADAIDGAGNVVRVKLHADQTKLPTILEIDYTIPADAMDGNSFWRTTLRAPVFQSPVVIAQMRWQLTTMAPVIATSLGRNVAAETHWSLQHWLPTPESSVTSADWDGWLIGKDSTKDPMPVTYSITHLSMQPETVYHLDRRIWLLGCSGILLVIALGGYFSPLPRVGYWLLLLGVVVAVLSLGVFVPALFPPVLFGLQPGIVLVLVVGAAHWLLRERQRGRFAAGNGFSRSKPSSTLMRTSAQRSREASTVDAPVPSAPSGDAPPKSVVP